MIRIFLGLCAALVIAVPGVARAEGEGEGEAHELFREAREAFDAGHFPRARDLLRRSLELSPRRATAVNLARVLRATGDMVEAESLIESLLEGRYGALEEGDRADMERLLEEVRRDIATLTVELRGAASGVLRLDGVDVATLHANDRYEARLDAGPHVLTLATSDGRQVEQRVDVTRGEQIAVRLTVPALSNRRAPADGGAGERDESGGFWSTAWPWIGLGVLVVGGAALVWWLSRPEPTNDPVWGYAPAPLLSF